MKILVVGAGVFGSVCARELADAGHDVLVVDKRGHVAGNTYTRYNEEAGCNQHVYGAHIFHTENKTVWDYVNRFAEFNDYVHKVIVNNGGALLSFPFNLMTLYQVFGVTSPSEAEEVLTRERKPIANPQNLEEWCLSEIGAVLYEKFIKHYTAKQWGTDPRNLPVSIIKRIPTRMTFDDRYFADRYQGIPIGGYTALFGGMLKGIPTELNHDFTEGIDVLSKYDRVVYSGSLDSLFGYNEGDLEYRSLRFETYLSDSGQGNSVINYTGPEERYTRIIEHKHFDMSYTKRPTLLTKEYPAAWERGAPEYYPIESDKNKEIWNRYRKMLPKQFVVGGRLGLYRYLDMAPVVQLALKTVGEMLA